VDVDPNAGCPKAGVDFVPKPVCPKPEAGFGTSCCEFSGEGESGLAWFQLEKAPNPGLMVDEPKAGVVGVTDGWFTEEPNNPLWPFPCAGFEAPAPPNDRPPKPPPPESIPIETSLIISEDFRSPCVSTKVGLLFAKAPESPPGVPFEPNAGWPKDAGFRNDDD